MNHSEILARIDEIVSEIRKVKPMRVTNSYRFTLKNDQECIGYLTQVGAEKAGSRLSVYLITGKTVVDKVLHGL